MNQDYIIPNPWSIIEEGFDKNQVKASESLFSIGNGAMGQRANFEEHYSGPSFQGSYIGGVYYPDKTRVGWWKNGYPEYFAKVLNAPNWIGINVSIGGITLDLNTCKSVSNFRRELNMKDGWYLRTFEALLENDIRIRVQSKRFLSLAIDELGAIQFDIELLEGKAHVSIEPYLDSGILNTDSNWDDTFWNTSTVSHNSDRAFIEAQTLKTNFATCTYMLATAKLDKAKLALVETQKRDKFIGFQFSTPMEQGQTLRLTKFGGYTVSRRHAPENLIEAANNALDKAIKRGFDGLLQQQKDVWAEIWKMSDITISGDLKAQQGIRFNIFQLNQTYLGEDAGLNIGPKGFTGEKYGGSTYWDTEAYCLPFYMATKNEQVAKNLLKYRYDHLGKAIENASKLGFTNGAALYPMVTMNGEECHNEWEITFEEIHRNSAIAFAIYNYYRYTEDYSYIVQMGIDVLVGIARFWQQRASFSKQKNKYVILGVTGPNEYENNVNNNWYTNYSAQWCLRYTLDQLKNIEKEYPTENQRILSSLNLDFKELEEWQKVADQMYFPSSKELGVYLQQDGFLDKQMIKVADLAADDRPINQKWSWDRILRSPYIKQADVLQGFYFFEDHFKKEELEKHFDFYEPFTVHESSLSPCVHSILAAKLGRMSQAYEFYLRTSRLDLDDYNKEVEEGLHITSMAGTWMSIVEGFGGMRVIDDTLSFSPQIPKEWEAYSFKINFRDKILKVNVTHESTQINYEGADELVVYLNGKATTLKESK